MSTKWRRTIHTFLDENPPSIVDRLNTFDHRSFLLSDGNTSVLNYSQNRVGSRSRGVGYYDYTLHAEIALLKEIDYEDLYDRTLVVVRIEYDEEGVIRLRNSTPCCKCQRVLDKFIRKYRLKIQHS
jgi:hypothetical protein